MKKCSKCGAIMEEKSNFCTQCGEKINDNTITKKNNIVTVVCIVAAIIVLFLLFPVFKECYEGFKYCTNDCYPSTCIDDDDDYDYDDYEDDEQNIDG